MGKLCDLGKHFIPCRRVLAQPRFEHNYRLSRSRLGSENPVAPNINFLFSIRLRECLQGTDADYRQKSKSRNLPPHADLQIKIGLPRPQSSMNVTNGSFTGPGASFSFRVSNARWEERIRRSAG